MAVLLAVNKILLEVTGDVVTDQNAGGVVEKSDDATVQLGLDLNTVDFLANDKCAEEDNNEEESLEEQIDEGIRYFSHLYEYMYVSA